jgi:hypothetical protein
MRKTADYRKHAEECRMLARTAAKGEQRDQLLVMAQTWDRLAQERVPLADGDGPGDGPGNDNGGGKDAFGKG